MQPWTLQSCCPFIFSSIWYASANLLLVLVLVFWAITIPMRFTVPMRSIPQESMVVRQIILGILYGRLPSHWVSSGKYGLEEPIGICVEYRTEFLLKRRNGILKISWRDFRLGTNHIGYLLSGRYHPSAAYQRLHERRACGTNRESRRMVGQSSNWKPISGIHTILRDFRLGKQIIMGILLLGDYTNPLYLQESMAWWIQLRSHVWGRTEFSLKSLSSRIHIWISGMTFWRSQSYWYIIPSFHFVFPSLFYLSCLSFSIVTDGGTNFSPRLTSQKESTSMAIGGSFQWRSIVKTIHTRSGN